MIKENNIRIITRGDKNFPALLEQINDAPEKLYCLGDIDLLNKTCISIVGARKCSEYGRQVALKLGKVLANNNIVTVSGMAEGIDSFAHYGALDNEGGTIGVLGCGVDICYPKHNKHLYNKICQEGLLISEHPPGTPPKQWHFPRRNRIISALSQVVVVVEASCDSGSLITAEIAAEQGKEIIAVPGNINSTYSLGCNKLIADGARIMTVPEDVLRLINVEPRLEREEETLMGEDEAKIYKILKEQGELSLEHLCRILHQEPTKISGIIAIMELKGLISYQLGKIFIAKF